MVTLRSNESPQFFEFPEEYDALKFAELSIDEKELILAYRTSDSKEDFLKLIKNNKK